MPIFTPYADKDPHIRAVAIGELHGRIFFSSAAHHAQPAEVVRDPVEPPSISTWAGPPLFPKPELPLAPRPPVTVKRLAGSFTVVP